MLEATGITPVPGSNYGQKPGTHHFRSVACVHVVYQHQLSGTLGGGGGDPIPQYRKKNLSLEVFFAVLWLTVIPTETLLYDSIVQIKPPKPLL